MGASRYGIALAIALTFVVGCKVGPDYVRPDIETPDFWHQELAEGIERGDAGHETWWDTFGDAKLGELIGRAKDGNLNLHAALSRIKEARALRRFEVGGYYPTVNAGGKIDLGRTSESVQPFLPPGVDRVDSLYSLGFDATWEIDVWGKVARGVESADAGIEASVEDFRDTLVVLYAEIALNYFEVRALQARIRYAEENVRTQKGSLELTKNRFDAEIAPELDVRQAELNLATTESAIPALRASLVASINRISVLLGQSPGELKDELKIPAEIPDPPDKVLIGIPANLLRQRPDVRAAERRLAAQTALIGVATAQLYPSFRLDGVLTQQTLGTTNNFFSGDNTTWAIVPGVSWNILDRGRIFAIIDVEEERTQQSLLFYRQTILLALEEVENSLTSYLRERERVAALERAVAAAARSVELATTLYRTGVTDFQNVLDMERTLAVQQDNLAASEGLVVQQLVRLYKALGGGWTPADPVEPAEEEEEKKADTQPAN